MGYYFTRQVRHALLRAQEHTCALCGDKFLPADEPRLRPTVDHVIPLSAGGGGLLGNIVMAHWICNGRKADRTPTGCELIWLMAVNNRLDVEPKRW